MTDKPKILLFQLADRLSEGIMRGHDWPNSDDELLRLQCSDELRRLYLDNLALRAAGKMALEALDLSIPMGSDVAANLELSKDAMRNAIKGQP